MNFIDQLETLGLNGRQSKVYLALVQHGALGAISLAQYTGLKNPTVYDVLEVLKTRGLVSEVPGGGRKKFMAEPPARLQEQENRRRDALDSILPDLEELYNSNGNRPIIHYYEGGDTRVAHDDLLGSREKAYYYFGSTEEMFKLSSERYLQDFYRRRIAAGVWSYGIRNAHNEVSCDYMKSCKKNLRSIRYLPLDWGDGIAGIYLYDGKINIHASVKENYAIILESQPLYRVMKTLWKCLWKISTPPPDSE